MIGKKLPPTGFAVALGLPPGLGITGPQRFPLQQQQGNKDIRLGEASHDA